MRKEVLLAYYPKITLAKYRQIIEVFGSVTDAWVAPVRDWHALSWDEDAIYAFFEWKEAIREEELDAILDREGIQTVTSDESCYPSLLKQIYDPPFCLFIRGALPPYPCPLAVVGSRAASDYGREVTKALVTVLAAHHVTIVSGLALGIDGIAHGAALRGGGKTVAVLGTGIDDAHLYPATHAGLAREIIGSGGAVLSEYPPGFEATAYSFPRRNRIIAGLTLGTLVIEAGEGSGALITAQCSLDAGREVLAVPQNIDSDTARGVNALLQSGAHMVTCAEDILAVLHLETNEVSASLPDITVASPVEAVLLAELSRLPVHVDTLIRACGLPSAEVASTLTLMEIAGKVRQVDGMRYVRGR